MRWHGRTGRGLGECRCCNQKQENKKKRDSAHERLGSEHQLNVDNSQQEYTLGSREWSVILRTRRESPLFRECKLSTSVHARPVPDDAIRVVSPLKFGNSSISGG